MRKHRLFSYALNACEAMRKYSEFNERNVKGERAMTNAIEKYNYLRELYIQTGDERILHEANALAKEMLRVHNKSIRKEKVIALSLDALRIIAFVIGLFLIVWSADNLTGTLGFKLVYALEICFVGFLCYCGIDWLQAKVKRV